MKKLTGIALCAPAALLLCSCGPALQPKTIVMTAANISAEPGGLTVVYQIVNSTDTLAQYGAHYMIDRLDGEEWIPMPVNDETMFIEMMYSLQPGDTSQLYSVEMHPEQFAYPAGEYRIRKELYAGDRQMTLTAPFTLAGERRARPEVNIEITPDVYDGVPEKITYTVTNNTSGRIEFGTYFIMDRLVGLKWQEVPLAEVSFFNDLAINPPPGQSYSDDVYLLRDRIEYPAGVYRMRKEVNVNGSERMMYAMFRIR